ncbi:MAG: 16S rRNA (guanine(527)-N(7))-methyltransferase RsmG [Rhodospirillales bacterium]
MSAGVSRETTDRLVGYSELLLNWNQRINLVGRSDEASLWARHIEDSLQLVPLIPPGTDRGIDLGSGAGFPGLVLAIATGIRFDLVEADHRKAAFLREAAREAGAPAKVHAVRIEGADIAPAGLVTARALAPLPELLSLAHRFVAPGGVALFPKGAAVEQELTAARAEWNMRVERFPSRTHPDGAILRLSEVQRA